MTRNSQKQEATTKLSSAPLLPIEADMKLFVDREEEEKMVSKAIANGQHALVLGSRGAGKTVLLNRTVYTHSSEKNVILVQATPLASRSGPRDIIELLIFQLRKTMKTTPGGRLREVLESVSMSISFTGWELTSRGLEPGAVTDYELLDHFQDVLISVWKKHFRVIFLIDGLDKNVEGFTNFFGQLRDYLWRTRAIFVAVGNSEKKGLYIQPPVDSFFDILIELKPLSYDSLHELILRRSGQGTFSEQHLRNIYRVSRGNPREAIRLAQIALNRHLSAGQLLKIAEADRKVVQGVTDSEKSVIEYLAKEGSACASDSDFQRALGITRSRLSQILLGLKKRGVVTSFREGRRQFYQIRDIWTEE